MTVQTPDYTVIAATELYGREPITPLERAHVYVRTVELTVAAGAWPIAFVGNGKNADAALRHAYQHLARIKETEQWLLNEE
jgi:hypothetical protein